MINDESAEEVVFQRLNLDTKSSYPLTSEEQNHLSMYAEQEDFEDEGADVYQQLAEKDHYLMLVAEAGKDLLEKNQVLTGKFQSLQEEYLQKIDSLEEDRHYLRKELNDRETNYESRMQELQTEIYRLGGQLQMVQKSSRTIENSTQSSYESLANQNITLLHELNQVKSFNKDLTQQVGLLTGRIDEQQNVIAEKVFNSVLHESTESKSESDRASYHQIENPELPKLKETLKQVTDQKDFLEESLNELVNAKYGNNKNNKHDTGGNVSTLEADVSNLRQQMMMCQEEIQLTRRRNELLKDQLEEYVLMQSSSQQSVPRNTSLLSELELSMPEVDMNRLVVSTPLRNNAESSNNDGMSNPQSESSTHVHRNEYERLRKDFQEVFQKLQRIKNELTDDIDHVTSTFVNSDDVIKLADEVVRLIHIRTMGLSLVGPHHHNHNEEGYEVDNISQADSQASDHDTDLFEQHIHDLNQRLNITTLELAKVKRELVNAQTASYESKDRADELEVKSNCQEREVENLRRERDILLNDKSMDDKLLKAIEDRDDALKRENELKAQYETAQSDMKKLNDQLIASVQQKLELSEQLEQWQFDMAALIDQQLSVKVKRDNQKSKRRGSNKNPTKSPVKSTRSFAAKLFAYKSSKETPR